MRLRRLDGIVHILFVLWSYGLGNLYTCVRIHRIPSIVSVTWHCIFTVACAPRGNIDSPLVFYFPHRRANVCHISVELRVSIIRQISIGIDLCHDWSGKLFQLQCVWRCILKQEPLAPLLAWSWMCNQTIDLISTYFDLLATVDWVFHDMLSFLYCFCWTNVDGCYHRFLVFVPKWNENWHQEHQRKSFGKRHPIPGPVAELAEGVLVHYCINSLE